jgi:hypothetical protein
VDLLHHSTEPGVERRIRCRELPNRRFVRRFHIDQGEGAVRRLLMPGSMMLMPASRMAASCSARRGPAISSSVSRSNSYLPDTWHCERESRLVATSGSDVLWSCPGFTDSCLMRQRSRTCGRYDGIRVGVDHCPRSRWTGPLDAQTRTLRRIAQYRCGLPAAPRAGTGMRRRDMSTTGRGLVLPSRFLPGLVVLTLCELPAAAVGATT